MFTSNVEDVGKVAEQFFPRHEEEEPQGDEEMKVERESEGKGEENASATETQPPTQEREEVRDQEMGETREDPKESRAEDVVMKEVTEPQAVEEKTSDDALPEASTEVEASEERGESATAEQQAGVAT